MGLPKSAVHLLLHTARSRPFTGQVATLGRQHVYLTERELRELASKQRVTLQPVTATLHRDPELCRCGYLSDDSLYEMLGFEKSVRIDRSGYEDAEVQLDLNDATTPESLCESCEVVIDGGTVEHVFQLPRALAHCLRLVKTGGRIIHLTPSSNCVDHGFYSVSPTLYADFYSASGCEIEALYLCRVPHRFERRPWEVFDCLQRDRDWGAIGGLTGNAWFTYCVVRKLPGAESRDPQQAMYRSTWEAAAISGGSKDNGIQVSESISEPAQTKAGRLLSLTQHTPWLHRPAVACVRLWRRLRNGWQEFRRRRKPFPLVGKF